MGINIVLEDEDGGEIAVVGDPTNFLHEILPSVESLEFRCLGFVDRYGDTTFNRLQMDDVQRELNLLRSKSNQSEVQALLDQISALAQRCKSDVHTYLKFYGD